MISVEEWRQRARRRLPRFVFDYVEGGAEQELTLARNRAALARCVLLPQRLSDVTHIDMSTTLFGARQSSPLLVAPTGLNGLLWPQGDVQLASAAAQAKVPLVLSTAANASLETVARASDGERWFQLYVLENRDIAAALLARAAATGYRVLVLTVDVPCNGDRQRDRRNGFAFPLRLGPRLALDALTHPRWLLGLRRGGLPTFGNLDATDASARGALLQRSMDRSLSWRCLDWLRQHWHGPIVLKGLLSVGDALRAAECGVDGVVLSNHGGRQLDCVPAPMELLPAVAAAVGQRLTLLIDSGFRSGSDVVKAIAHGAHGVLIGRPVLYGLAAAGAAGAYTVLEQLKAQIQHTLTLAGYGDLQALRCGAASHALSTH